MKLKNSNIIFHLITVIVLCVFYNPTAASFGNTEEKEKTDLHQKGIEALKNKDTVKAESLFKESIREYKDAPSYYQLAKIYLYRNSFLSRNKAYENFRRAVLIEPGNVEYRLAFASLMKDFARRSSEDEFKRIIALDSTQVKVWLNLGEIKDEDFTEYNNSVRKMSDEFYGSLQEYADEDYYEAEKYYLTVLKYDSTNYDANIKLALLNEKAGKPGKGIPYLERLVNISKDDNDVHLCLGLLLYKTQKMKECYEEYKKALTLMNNEERNDFTFNSVKLLIEPALGDVVDALDDFELKQFIDVYWKVFDPLYMTEYNERLLEHYSRVAFANLHFSVPKMGKIGWKTDRGEAVLRYGEPVNFMRIRPSIGDGGVSMKTEVWNYKNITLGFTDMALSGNYRFSVPAAGKDKMIPQFNGDTQFFFENLRRVYYTDYDPKFEGPKFDVPYSITQFKNSERRNHTDVYVNYVLKVPDSLYKFRSEGLHENITSLTYNVGLFFFDKNYTQQFQKLTKVEVEKDEGEVLIKSLEATARSDSGFASFEIIRDIDKGTSANRSGLKIKKFSHVRLDMSDVLLAGYVGIDSIKGTAITRHKLKIIPSPTGEFTKQDPLFIYYEVYNLKKGRNNLTDFEQRISIREYEEQPTDGLESAAKSVLNFFGIGKKEEIVLTSNYQTLEADPQIYFQLDFNNYISGKYIVTVTVQDKISGQETHSSSIVGWNYND